MNPAAGRVTVWEGLSCWSRGEDSALPLQGLRDRSLGGELGCLEQSKKNVTAWESSPLGEPACPTDRRVCYWWKQEERQGSSSFSLRHTFQFPVSISRGSNQGGSQPGEVVLRAPLPCSAQLSTAEERSEGKQVRGQLNLPAMSSAEASSPSLTTHARSPS